MPPFPTDVTPPADKVAALVEEFLEERRSEAHASRPRISPKAWRHALTALLVVVCAATWLVPLPDATPRPPDPGLTRASDEFALFLAAQRIDDFQMRRGRLPSTPGDAGVKDPVMQLTGRPDGSFLLTRAGADPEVRFDSRDSMRTGVRAAIAVLEGTKR